jgi:hypothetical protein
MGFIERNRKNLAGAFKVLVAGFQARHGGNTLAGGSLRNHWPVQLLQIQAHARDSKARVLVVKARNFPVAARFVWKYQCSCLFTPIKTRGMPNKLRAALRQA